ncbi:hypothetical protein FA048_06970 [Pedobacter polaris]|uniref:Lipoprotein n=1 Tax=Pedobacter polaris TaxID=2571273 RepID=A0A4U1CSE4_9SPHI|nr:hypothetical protein [Pedobacter polaris]TKC09945.1 hypothetical protein FA048_06970 [Pedobacter polaris]
MKKIIYLLSCLLLVSCSQEQSPVKNTIPIKTATKDKPVLNNSLNKVVPIPKSVVEIKQSYTATINKLKNGVLDSITLKYNCNNERSGTIVYFSENGKLLMIKHNYNEYDHHSATDQYFLNDKTLYFAYLNRLSWSFVSGATAEGATKDDITEQRLYIVDNQAIQCLEKKYSIFSQATNNPKPNAVPNKLVNCKPLKPIISEFNKLLAFQHNSKKGCLEK